MFRHTDKPRAANPRPDGVRIYRTPAARPRKRRDVSHLARTVTAILLVLVGLGVMLYPKLTDLRYEFSQWQLGRTAEAGAAEPVAGASADGDGGGVVLPGGAVARLEIPAIGVDAFVVEGIDGDALARGPGHYPDTPLPGEPGNAAIAGHRTMHGHVFQDLDRLRSGDEIRTQARGGSAVYRVSEVLVVRPWDTEVVRSSGGDLLTLTTCHPKGSAARRLVVVAIRAD